MPIRIAQYGTKHGHAAGKLEALRSNPGVELAGVFEPDRERRAECERSGAPYDHLRWFATEADMLGDPTIVAVAAEGRNDESLQQAAACIEAGKHLWYDKPAGEDLEAWKRLLSDARESGRVVQMGYMFRYHNGFRLIADWVHRGVLGRVFKVRANMSTSISLAQRAVIARHQGGILYDLGGHMLDQIVWLLGRPDAITTFLRTDDTPPPFSDNTLAVLSYPGAIVMLDIAAMETPPMARRFEVYGTNGSAIMEPFEPAGPVHLRLREARGELAAGEHVMHLEGQTRQRLYELELEHFLYAIAGTAAPDRSYDHEFLVQETLLRAVRA